MSLGHLSLQIRPGVHGIIINSTRGAPPTKSPYCPPPRRALFAPFSPSLLWACAARQAGSVLEGASAAHRLQSLEVAVAREAELRLAAFAHLDATAHQRGGAARPSYGNDDDDDDEPYRRRAKGGGGRRSGGGRGGGGDGVDASVANVAAFLREGAAEAAAAVADELADGERKFGRFQAEADAEKGAEEEENDDDEDDGGEEPEFDDGGSGVLSGDMPFAGGGWCVLCS